MSTASLKWDGCTLDSAEEWSKTLIGLNQGKQMLRSGYNEFPN